MANSNHSKISVLLTCLVLLFCISPAIAQNQNPGARAKPGDILKIAPAESVLVVEIDSFEYTLSTLDRFLTGISPLPMGVQMRVRTQFAQILGNPELAGIDMNGTFGVFVFAPPEPQTPGQPRQISPETSGLVALLVPVTEYDQFVTSNPNCSGPDAQDFSRIKVGTDSMLIKQAGAYAMVTPDVFSEKAIAIANAVAATASNPPIGDMEIFAPKVASKPIRLFVDTRKSTSGLSPQIQQMQQQANGMANQQGQSLGPNMMNLESLTKAAKDIEFVTIGLNPTASALNASVEIAAIPNRPMEAMFTPDSQELAVKMAKLQAKPPSQMGPALSPIVALLPDATNANFVGTFSILDIIQLVATMLPIKLPPIEAEITSNASYAISASDGTMQIDIALPKEHVQEVVVAAMSMQQAAIANLQSAQPQQAPTPQRTEPIVPAPVTPEPLDSSSITAGPITGEVGVKVAGARLVRYSDIKRRVLPLGRTDGYTLSLIAELPEPVLQISGGSLEKAQTNTGKSLLPEHSWQCRIKLVRLSTDRRTAVFDVELALPDYNVKVIEELSGNLEYVIAGADKELDLGVMPMKSGARGQALNAVISAIKEDPYGNNPTILSLALDMPAEALKSASFLANGTTKLSVNSAGHTSVADRTTFKFAVKDQIPQQARIVLTIHDNFQRGVMPFRITRISLTGEPAE